MLSAIVDTFVPAEVKFVVMEAEGRQKARKRSRSDINKSAPGRVNLSRDADRSKSLARSCVAQTAWIARSLSFAESPSFVARPAIASSSLEVRIEGENYMPAIQGDIVPLW